MATIARIPAADAAAVRASHYFTDNTKHSEASEVSDFDETLSGKWTSLENPVLKVEREVEQEDLHVVITFPFNNQLKRLSEKNEKQRPKC